MFDYPVSAFASIISSAFVCSLYIPIYVIALMWFARNSKVKAFLDTVCSYNFITISGMIVLFMCVLLTVFHLAGFWWTWQSFGLQYLTVVTVFILVHKYIGNFNAVAVGIAISSISIGLWEMPYQAVIKMLYDVPQLSFSDGISMLTYQLEIQIPYIIGGVCILIWYYQFHLFRFNMLVLLFIGLLACGYLYWWINGFWIEMVYDWATFTWHNQPLQYDVRSVYRMLKVIYPVIFIISLAHNYKRSEVYAS